VVPESIMPGYPVLAETDLKYGDIAQHLQANAALGVPYDAAMIEAARTDVMVQASVDADGVDDFQARYPKAQARDFDGNPDRLTELDALIAYLQMLGTLVDFQVYEPTAGTNSR
jgi:cytochrome c oxidase cbb3-type subunit 2